MIDANKNEVDQMSDALDRQREDTVEPICLLESTIARMKDNMAALQSLQTIPPMTK